LQRVVIRYVNIYMILIPITLRLQRKLNDTVSRVERIQIIKEIKEKKEQIAKEQREKLEQATHDEKILVKKISQLKRDIRGHSVPRVKHLGKDRTHAKYWYFDNFNSAIDFGCGRLFVESNDGSSWGYYHTREQVRKRMTSSFLNYKF
jgi:hypothetical protein